MAAPFPALGTDSSDAGHTVATGSLHRTDTPPKTLRGLNKPKCIQCGNVARSRCPYQSCKSCCSKAQNPCHIHVLKANATFPDKSPTSSTFFDQQPTEGGLAASSLRAASLRQLSNNFSQFNNLQTSRSKKPLTKKEAAAINEWRFSKLKEYWERNIEVENEAFDRYIQNMSLLKEIFSVKSILENSRTGSTEDGSISLNPGHASAEGDTEKMNTGQMLKFRLNTTRSDNFRKRIQEIVEVGLNKLQKRDCNHMPGKRPEKAKSLWVDRASTLSDLNAKLTKPQNEEDLASCMEMKAHLYDSHSQVEATDVELSNERTAKNDLASRKELDYLSQKLFRTVEIDQEDLNRIGAHFSSLEKVANL